MWRRKAIDTAGGWNSRTTVEDMDLSLRAYLAGWKAIYLRHVTVLNEVGVLLRLLIHCSLLTSRGTALQSLARLPLKEEAQAYPWHSVH